MNQWLMQHRLVTGNLTVVIMLAVLGSAACKHEPSSAVIQGRADVAQAQTALGRAEEAAREAERGVPLAREAIGPARQAVEQQQARCRAADAAFHAADATFSRVRAEYMARADRLCCDPGQSPETDRAMANMRNRGAEKDRICFADTQQVQLGLERAEGNAREAVRRAALAQESVEQARRALSEKQERLRALEQAEAQ